MEKDTRVNKILSKKNVSISGRVQDQWLVLRVSIVSKTIILTVFCGHGTVLMSESGIFHNGRNFMIHLENTSIEPVITPGLVIRKVSQSLLAGWYISPGDLWERKRSRSLPTDWSSGDI